MLWAARACRASLSSGRLRLQARVWPPRDCDAPGAGCLPLAPSGHVGAVAQLNPGDRPHEQRTATAAMVRGLQEGPSLRRPHPEALQDQPQRRACGASLRADPCARVLSGIQGAPIEGMARSERVTIGAMSCSTGGPEASRPVLLALAHET